MSDLESRWSKEDHKGFCADCNERKWISVKERLPEEEDFYIAFDGEWVGIAYMEENRFEKMYNYGTVVTHWMPLPQPPEANGLD